MTSRQAARAWLRGLAAGPLALVAACLVMAGASLWVPAGAGQVNNLALPIILFPLLWTASFLYACLDRRAGRACVVLGVLIAVNGAAIWLHLSGSQATSGVLSLDDGGAYAAMTFQSAASPFAGCA